MPISFEPKPSITALEDWRLLDEYFPFIDKSGDNLFISVKSAHLTPGNDQETSLLYFIGG